MQKQVTRKHSFIFVYCVYVIPYVSTVFVYVTLYAYYLPHNANRLVDLKFSIQKHVLYASVFLSSELDTRFGSARHGLVYAKARRNAVRSHGGQNGEMLFWTVVVSKACQTNLHSLRPVF
jgi:hypothetical protein